LVFAAERKVFVCESSTGLIESVELNSGSHQREWEMDSGACGALAFDRGRNILYIADRSKPRVLAADAHGRNVSELTLSLPAAALAISSDSKSLFAASGQWLYFFSLTDALKSQGRIDTGPGAISSLCYAAGRVYASKQETDSILAIDPGGHGVLFEVPLRIPGLEQFRGIAPAEIVFEPKSERLLVAASGINALAVIDPAKRSVAGYLPAGWRPAGLVIANGYLCVMNSGNGSVSRFQPEFNGLAADTEFVFASNGFNPRPEVAHPAPRAAHVVLIVKGDFSFDEVLGDLGGARRVMGAPELASLGRDGYATGEGKRLSLHHVNITPNHHALAERWSFSDNYYAYGDFDLRPLFERANRAGIESLVMADPDPHMSDSQRASNFVRAMEMRSTTPSGLPRLILLVLPGGKVSEPVPDRGYPYAVSPVAENDLALGTVIDYLSHSRWWRDMSVFITEAGAAGRDHISPFRTLLLSCGGLIRNGYVDHRNTDVSGLLRTIGSLLDLPPGNLNEAASIPLLDFIHPNPEPAPYTYQPIDRRLFSAPSH
jgi:hypothetical protein